MNNLLLGLSPNGDGTATVPTTNHGGKKWAICGKLLDGKFCDSDKQIHTLKNAKLEGNLVKLEENSDLLAGK